MRRLSLLLAVGGLLTAMQGCHIAGKCDCDWPGYDHSTPSALVPVAPVAPVAYVKKDAPQADKVAQAVPAAPTEAKPGQAQGNSPSAAAAPAAVP
jgi:hypothetical protein